MKRILFAGSLILAALLSGQYPPKGGTTLAKESDLVVHEWGTFTSIAGQDGVALDWRPLNGATDLPKFVYTMNGEGGYRGTRGFSGKGEIARIRMETPVIYFYTKKEMEIDVSVNFPEGKITEWYPQAGIVNNNYLPDSTGRFHDGITWGKIKLMPNASENFLREAAYSHYYPARATDAVPIQVCNADKTKIETEKFLFYRGIGNFDLPLNVKLNGDSVLLSMKGQNLDSKQKSAPGLINVLLFENRGGRIGFKFVDEVNGPTAVDRPQLTNSLDQVYAELERVLIAQGLYPKEARSMVATWKDSWFEEGLRVFYVLPRATTDRILPLRIDVPTKEIVRVLVGRAEVITPQMEGDVRRQVTLLRSTSELVRQAARNELKQHGRFYEPILRSILATETDPAMRDQLAQLIDTP
ncbi:MAG: hypothetical protein ABIP75_18300 [Pyrinomonadaceae bacterium]